MNLNEGDLFDEHYELIKLIDSGGFSEVWKAHYTIGDKIVALKIYPRLGDEGAKSVENEYSKFFELQHSNLLNARHFGRYKGHPYLVMRYYSGGNAAYKIGEMTEKEAAKCISQVASALKYLHSKGIAHLDIKPNNFLLDEYGDYHLADLGLSMKLRNTIRRYTQTNHPNTSVTSVGITPVAYRAPELCNDEEMTASLATDIWAMGASMYELITNYTPYGEGGWSKEKKGRLLKGLPVDFSESLYAIIKKCLSENVNERPSAAQLEKWANDFLEKGNWIVLPELKIPHSQQTQPLYNRGTKDARATPADLSIKGTNVPAKEGLTEKTGRWIGKRFRIFGIIVIVVVCLIVLIHALGSLSSSYEYKNTTDNSVNSDTTNLVSNSDKVSSPQVETHENSNKISYDSVASSSSDLIHGFVTDVYYWENFKVNTMDELPNIKRSLLKEVVSTNDFVFDELSKIIVMTDSASRSQLYINDKKEIKGNGDTKTLLYKCTTGKNKEGDIYNVYLNRAAFTIILIYIPDDDSPGTYNEFSIKNEVLSPKR